MGYDMLGAEAGPRLFPLYLTGWKRTRSSTVYSISAESDQRKPHSGSRQIHVQKAIIGSGFL